MDTDNYTQPLESVMREERKPRSLPLKARDHMELFEEWVRINPHTYGICNTITPLLARWLLERHPEMNIWTKHSLFDEMENNHEA